MSVSVLAELVNDRAQLWPWTVKKYHKLIKAGLLPEGEPYELLDGQLVRKDRSAKGADPMTVGPDHSWVVKALAKLTTKLSRLGCHVQTQQPITLPPDDEPEPDAAVIVGREEDFAGRHPGPDDVLCVIEVADASLRRDRTVKLKVYANAGIGSYVIVNLPDRLIEVYSEPLVGKGAYGKLVTLTPRERLELPGARGKRLLVPVKQLLPS